MKIAVEGCCHGQLDAIYATLLELEEREGIKIDLLICCGDFQAVRNSEDLNCMAVPNKYKNMGTFYKYYSGEKVAPVLTIFIGGNHEASNHLREIGYGGWAAPNIYYIGHAGVVNYGGLRIGGLSGIFKHYDYYKGHFESPHYTQETIRSTYHVRACDVFRLKQVTGNVDIMMSHDWPLGIHRHGNYKQLFRYKPYFEENADNELGSPPAMELLAHLRPSYWFSAHLHCKFTAICRHPDGSMTKFLALDKCLPRKHFLQIIDIPSLPGPHTLEYDKEWLSILKSTESDMIYTSGMWIEPQSKTLEIIDVDELSRSFGNDFKIPSNFEVTVDPHDTSKDIDYSTKAVIRESPQTKVFCEKLGIANPWFNARVTSSVRNPDEITLSSEDEVETGDCKKDDHVIGEQEKKLLPDILLSEEENVVSRNPDEITIECSDSDS